MKMVGLRLLVIAIIAAGAGLAQADVATFDNLGVSSPTGTDVPVGYDGIDWGAGIRYLSESQDPAYSTPHSGDNYIFNGGGSDATINFSFQNPSAYLEGAWFTRANVTLFDTDEVALVGLDDVGGEVVRTGWLALTDSPQYLTALGFDNPLIESITVDKSDVGWFTMDDLEYVHTPEPMTLGLLALGCLGIRRRKRS